MKILARVKLHERSSPEIAYVILAIGNFGGFYVSTLNINWNILIKVLSDIFNSSELKTLANTAKIKSLLKFLLVRYI